jgi:ApaG protein
MPSSVAAVRLYRVLQRQCRAQLPKTTASAVTSSFGDFLLQPPLDPRQAGSSRIARIPVATGKSLLQWLNHHLDDPSYEAWLEQVLVPDNNGYGVGGEDPGALVDWVVWASTGTVQDAIRLAFRMRSGDANGAGGGGRLEWAIRGYQLLLEQAALLRTFSCREERGLRIAATSQFVGPSSDKSRFAYRIRIENLASPEVQLLGRSWIIEEDRPPSSKDATVRVHDPAGGAVGQFPVLQRGQAFEYMSGCELATPTGSMKGCFHFRDASSEALFEVPVEPFLLQANEQSLGQPNN